MYYILYGGDITQNINNFKLLLSELIEDCPETKETIVNKINILDTIKYYLKADKQAIKHFYKGIEELQDELSKQHTLCPKCGNKLILIDGHYECPKCDLIEGE